MPHQATHEGLYFIGADALPLTHFFLQFSAWFRVPLLADYAFFFSFSAFHTHSFMGELMHTTQWEKEHTGCSPPGEERSSFQGAQIASFTVKQKINLPLPESMF